MSNGDHSATTMFAVAPPSPAAQMALRDASQLQLAYTFTSRPNPIRASTRGTDPNRISVQVMISNPRTRPVSVGGIAIAIPIGENGARTLSAIPTLPTPVYDRTGQWSITVSGGRVLVEPADGASGEVTDTIIFSLEQIPVNQEPGVVPITITEVNGSGQRIADAVTYSLVKLASDFPVIDFRADPPVLGDLATGSRLYWRCSDEGRRYSYALSSEGWQPRNCLNGGVCFSCADGAAGVDTPDLTATTTFTLSVIETDAAGGRVVRAMLTTAVRVEVPGISQNSRATQLGRSGRLMELRWIAANAEYCSLRLDGAVIVERAPANTYKSGYLLPLAAGPGRHQLSLVAHGASGATATFIFPDIMIQPPVSIGLMGNASSIAVTPDGRRAFVTSHEGEWHMGAIMGGGSIQRSNPYMEVIDLAGMKWERAIPLGVVPASVAVTADGRFAVAGVGFLSSAFFGGSRDSVATVDTSSLAAGVQRVPVGLPLALASAHFGARVLTANATAEVFKSTLLAQDVSDGSQTIPAIDLDYCVTGLAVTLDRSLCVAVGVIMAGDDTWASKATIARIGGSPTTTWPIAVPAKSLGVAVTPDGALALVVGAGEEMTVIDIRNRAAESRTIPIGPSGMDDPIVILSGLGRSLIAISADGRLAYVLRAGGHELVVVDIPGRSVRARMPIPSTSSVTLTPDGRTVLLAGGKTVTIM